MTDNVVKFYPADVSKSADAVLEQAVGQFGEVLIIGWDKSDNMDVRCTQGLVDGGEMLWLIEKFKFNLLAGEYGGEE